MFDNIFITFVRKTMEELLALIRRSDDNSALISLKKAFADAIEGAIKKDWDMFRSMMRAAKEYRHKQSAGYYLNHEDGVVTMKGFTEYITAVENDINKIPTECGFKAEVIDILYLRLGNIKIDKRLLLKKED